MAKSQVEKVETNIEIDEDIALHKRGWILQRIGWSIIFLFILSAALGFFGDGVASKSRLQSPQVTIEFDRFYREEARMELKIELAGITDAGAGIALPNNYLKNFRIENIVPEPKENRVENNFVHYVFNGQDNLQITFYLIPSQIGEISGDIYINSNKYHLNHFIYP